MKASIIATLIASTATNTAAQGLYRFSTCGQEFTTLQKCLNTNSCDGCNIVGPFGNPFQAGFCETTADSLCHGFGCCEPCEAEFETYEKCFADLISSVTFGGCKVDCEEATTPTATPTVSPTTAFEANSAITSNSNNNCIQKFNKFRKCVKNNDDQCSDCPVVGPPTNPFEVGFCDSVENSICAANNCCEPCEEDFEEYKECTADFVKMMTFGKCEVDCDAKDSALPAMSGASFVDALQDDQQGCLNHFGAYASCVAQNPLVCGSCALLNLPNNPFENGFCDSATESICSIGSCCEPCDEEFKKFDDCFEDVVSDITRGNCKIDCDTFESKGNCLTKINKYATCVGDNALECGSCALLNFPTEDPREAGFCAVAKDAYCGFGNCCATCEAEFKEADDCFADVVGLATRGNCDLGCDDFVATEGAAPSNCIKSFNDYTECVQSNPFQCLSCAVSNLPSNPFEDGFCDSVSTSICEIGGCCEPCADEFDRFDECFESFVSTVTLGKCEFDCDDVNSSETKLLPSPDNSVIPVEQAGGETCVNKAHAAYATCVERNPQDCAFCFVPNPLTFFDQTAPNLCHMASDTICSVEGCCAPCQEELESMEGCLSGYISTVSNEECAIACQ